jgi:micrococcal nuclease
MANQPLRWDNIAGPNFRDAALFAENSRSAADAATKSFTDIIQRRNDVNSENWDTVKTNNTNAMQGAVQAPKTPDEYAALEAGLREQLAGYGAQVDGAAVRSAMDARMSTLQQRAKQAGEFKDWTTDQAEAPVTREIASANARQDPLTANLLMNANPGLRTMPALAAAYTASQHQVTADARAATTFGNQQNAEAQNVLTRPLEIQKLKSDLLNAKSSRELQAAQAEHYSQQSKKEKALGSSETLAKNGLTAAYKDSIYGGGDFNTVAGKKEFTSGLKDLGFKPAQIEDALAELGKSYPNGLKGSNGESIPLPINHLLDVASQSEDNSLAFPSAGWSRRGDNFVNLLDKSFKDPDVLERIGSGMALRNQLIYEPLTKDRVGSHVPNKGVSGSWDASGSEGGTAPTKQEATALLRVAAAGKPGAVAPSLAEQRIARAYEEAQKKSPETAVVTPKGAEDFSIDLATGKTQKASGPAVIPPDAKVTQQFTAVKMNPDFMPGKDTGMVTATVTGVEDGDGAYLKTKGTNRDLTCRLAGIDAPEVDHPKVGKKGQAFGEEAKTSLMNKILNQEVEVNVTQANDGKGRAICQITLKGRNINREELIAGAAWVNKTYNKNPEDIAAFDNARFLKKGLHADANATPPWDHRKTWR